MRLTLVLIPLLLAAQLAAQDKVLLMNGAELECRITGDSGTVMILETSRRNGKTRMREIHKSEIFSIVREGSPEKVLYVQDSLFGDVYSVDQMRIYLAGERDARSNYSAWPTALVGFVICGGMAAWGGEGFLTAIGPPIVYTLLQLAPKIHIREKYMSDVHYKYNEIYASGFEPPARSRKLMAALGGGYGGSATAVILYYILR